MDYLSPNITPARINSKAACTYLAATLRKIASDLEQRAIDLDMARDNSHLIDDKSPVLYCVSRLLNSGFTGEKAASECRKLASRYLINEADLWRIYRVKLAARARDQRAKRNQNIKLWDMQGQTGAQIAKRTGLSTGQISKILKSRQP